MSIFQTISTELKYIKFAFNLVKRAGRVDKYPMETVADLIEDQVKKNENKTAIEFEDKKYTYKELDEEANKEALFWLFIIIVLSFMFILNHEARSIKLSSLA